MSTIRVATAENFNSGAINFTGQNGLKGFVLFNTNTTTTLRSSYNVTSLTDNGTGDTTVTFTNAFSTGNSSIVACGAGGAAGRTFNMVSMRTTAPATTTRRMAIFTDSGSASDADYGEAHIAGTLA